MIDTNLRTAAFSMRTALVYSSGAAAIQQYEEMLPYLWCALQSYYG